MIQWGYYKATAEVYTLYFSIAFSSTAYTILGMSDRSRGGESTAYMSIDQKATSYAILRTSTWENNWLAVGY